MNMARTSTSRGANNANAEQRASRAQPRACRAEAYSDPASLWPPPTVHVQGQMQPQQKQLKKFTEHDGLNGLQLMASLSRSKNM